jgi:hypothetical protein
MFKIRICLVLSLLLVTATSALAELIPDPDVQRKINDARQVVTLTGRISHSNALGGYYLDAGSAGNKIILNQNYQTLKQLAEKRRNVKIQGRTSQFDISARSLYIEKIDGKPYHGDKAPLVKPPTKLTPLF